MPIPRHLRYSPVNWLIVNWGHGKGSFNDCGLPQPRCCDEPDEEQPAVCRPLPITEAIDTYDWARWLPEVMVGIDDPDEEIAASYVRESAIEFCRETRILQREVLIDLQPGVSVYPVFPYEDEVIVGALSASADRYQEGCTPCASPYEGSVYGIDFRFDPARKEVYVRGSCREGERLRLLVWAAPTEGACAHDQFIYDHFRRVIAQRARARYATAVHFRDQMLMRSLSPESEWERAILMTKRQTGTRPSMSRERAIGSGMWQTGGGLRRRGW